MTEPAPARASRPFRIGGALAVNRVGFGATRFTGSGIWGEPADLETALAMLEMACARWVEKFTTLDQQGKGG